MIAPHDLSSFDLLALDEVPGSLLAWTLGIGVLGVVVGAAIVALFLHARTLQKKREDESRRLRDDAARPLSPGPSRAAFGRVEPDGDEDVAIRVEIVQELVNAGARNAESHSWVEASRAVAARPFLLVREDGESVRVEPSDDSLVVQSLETIYSEPMPGPRVRFAQLRRGDTCLAVGDLVDGGDSQARGPYRSGSGLILRPPRVGRMLLAAPAAIDDRYRACIKFLYRAGLVLALAYCTFHGLFTVPFVVASLLGTHDTAEVIGVHEDHVLSVRTADGFVLKRQVRGSVFAEAVDARRRDERVTVPILRTWSWDRASYLGSEASLSPTWLVLGLVGVVVAVGRVLSGYGRKMDWYDQKRLDEEGGRGHWTSTRQVARIAAATPEQRKEQQRAFARVTRNMAARAADAPSAAPETPLESFGRARGFRVVSPLAITGDVRGVRVAVERPDAKGARVSVDVDASHMNADTLVALRERLGERLGGYQVVRLGAIARVEWVESGADELDAERLEEVLEEIADTCSGREGGAYR